MKLHAANRFASDDETNDNGEHATSSDVNMNANGRGDHNDSKQEGGLCRLSF